eukprot:TRINITY_DN1903_c0_g1_i2.p2 TRINITY_DN1903_c0_g1~~TRINITY_DN1903_c0_g1_i2.p2  ORF type:complete len:105 (-),score=33.95 TRINITY_DN1903_c0_g1_i2:62-334(-)
MAETELREAAKAGHIDVVKKLIEAGNIDINFQDKFKYTPLHLAAMFGHVEIVRYLLQKGADATMKNNDGETAADVAKGFVLAQEIRKFKK